MNDGSDVNVRILLSVEEYFGDFGIPVDVRVSEGLFKRFLSLECIYIEPSYNVNQLCSARRTREPLSSVVVSEF